MYDFFLYIKLIISNDLLYVRFFFILKWKKINIKIANINEIV